MGGNTYNRKYYLDSDLQLLVSKIGGYKSLFDENLVFDNEKEWRANISRHLDSDSCNRFYFLLEDPHHCKYCQKQLDISSYSYSGWNRGFAKYCPTCTEQGVWRKNLSKDKRRSRGQKISKSKYDFYQSKQGKETATSNGIKISNSLKKFHQTAAGETARKKSAEYNSKLMRQRIMTGEFTPNSNNRNTHWDCFYRGKKYRSSWEALYQYFDNEAEYETLRIPYRFDNKDCIYIIDFVNHYTKTVVEVKPKELLGNKKTQAKISAAKSWCSDNGYTFILADKDYLVSYSMPKDLTEFDIKTQNKIRKLYE